MKKSFWIYILALVLGLTLLCGCGEIDTSTDTETDTETEVADSSTETETDTETDTEADSSTETKTDTESDTESDTETETNTEKMEEPEIEPHVHTIGYNPARAVTCTTDGYTEGQMCSVCKEVLIPSVRIPATGHKWMGLKRVEPTCKQSGLTEGVKCEKCGEVALKQEYIAPLGHDVIIIPAIQSTCKRNGYTEGMECRRCRKVLIEREKLPLTDHKYIVHMPKEPTCTEAGNNLYQSCSVCSYEKNYEKILPIGHNYNEDYVCTMCNIDATTIQGLTFESNEEATEYALIGVKTPELISILYSDIELKYPRIVVPNTFKGLPVTSISEGTIDLGLPWSETLLELSIPSSITHIEKSAIASQAIVDLYYGGDVEDWCNITFDGNIMDSIYIDSGYTLRFNGEIVKEITVPASVSEIGNYQFYGCNSIKKVIISEGVTTIGERAILNIEEIEIPRSVTEIKQNTFGDKLKKINYLGDIEGWLNINYGSKNYSSNRELYINGESLDELVIPASVTEVREDAFRGVTNINSVVISEGVKKISLRAFNNCRNITSITIPKSVTSIGMDAFYLSGAAKINYLGDVIDWCNIVSDDSALLENVEFYINGELLTDLVVPSSVTKVKEFTFARYNHLTSVTFENGVTEIGASAFGMCINLKSVKFPETVTTIGSSAFASCFALKNLELPNGVTIIEGNAFNGCKFANLILPSSIEEIGSGAFSNNSQLLAVLIPSSVKTIGANAFSYCPNVRIYCEAKEVPSDWSQEWNGKAIYYLYSETKPQTDGNYWVYISGDIYVW